MVDSSPIAEKKDYECMICLTVPKVPIKHKVCQAIFCEDCFNSMKGGKANIECPKCKQPISAAEQKPDLQLQQEMTTKLVQTPCDDLVNLMEAEDHDRDCPMCKQLATNIIQAQVVPQEQQKATVNRSTYKCPFCHQANLAREGLLQHVAEYHPGQPAVCPICITYPHGDPNFVSRDLSGHLKLRHAYDYGEVIENEESEEMQLMKALQASLN